MFFRGWNKLVDYNIVYFGMEQITSGVNATKMTNSYVRLMLRTGNEIGDSSHPGSFFCFGEISGGSVVCAFHRNDLVRIGLNKGRTKMGMRVRIRIRIRVRVRVRVRVEQRWG